MTSNTQYSPKLLVIASYPPKGEKHSNAIVGGAMYAKNTLQAVMAEAKKKQTEPRITVLAEKLARQPEVATTTIGSHHKDSIASSAKQNPLQNDNEYTEDGVHVKRFWKRNSLSAYTSILKEIFSQHKDTKTVVIEFEFVMFGDRLSLLPLPLFVLMLKLMRKRVIFVFHQVVDHIGDMGGHLNIKTSGIKTNLLNKILQTLYASLVLVSNEVIVFEEVLKQRLARLGNEKKITVIPFGTESFTHAPAQTEARKTLTLPEDAYIVFVFGFIAWYKGSDWLVDVWKKGFPAEKKVRDSASIRSNNKNVPLLILGGGGNPNHMNKPYYVEYVENVKRKAAEIGITVTGFIPEEDLPLYFQAADLILLPYRTLMSSSGPLSLAFSFHKPFLLSRALWPVFETEDMAEALEEAGFTKDDVSFPLNDIFPDRLIHLKQDHVLQKKLVAFSTEIAQKRSWEKIGKMYYKAFFNK